MFIIHSKTHEETVMKKVIAAILSITMVMSLASCSKKTQGSSTAAPGATVNETFDTAPSESSGTVETVANPASEFVKDRVEKAKVSDEGEEEEVEYHIPELQIKSAYADSVNKEIAQAFEKYKKDLNNEDGLQFYSTAYIPYLTKEGILSLVFIAYEATDMNVYKVYNIDTKTGEKVENARIAEICGVSDIRKAAMDALQSWYNNMEIVKVKDYKVVAENGEKIDEQMKDVEKTFSEKYLNDKMQIGVTNEGKMFFVSQVCTMAGADFYDWIYDVSGNDVDDEENQYWVGWMDPDAEGEDIEIEEEDDDGI